MPKVILYFVFLIASILGTNFSAFGISQNQLKKYKAENKTYLSFEYSRPNFIYPGFEAYVRASDEKNLNRRYKLLNSIQAINPQWKKAIGIQKANILLKQGKYRQFYQLQKGISSKDFKKYFLSNVLGYLKKTKSLSLKDLNRIEKNFPALSESNEFLFRKLSFYRYGNNAYRETVKQMWLNGGYARYFSDKAKKKILVSVQSKASAKEWNEFLQRQYQKKHYRTVSSLGKKAIEQFNKKKQKPPGIYLTYLRALERRRLSSSILKVLENSKNESIFETRGHTLRQIKLRAYLRLKRYSVANRYIEALERNKISRKTLNVLRLMMAEHYFFYRQDYAKAKTFYSKISPELLTPIGAEKLQWEKYLLYHILNDRKNLEIVFRWAKDRKFISSVYGSSFCYWTLKNRRIHGIDIPKVNPCLNLYPNSYYAYKSLEIVSRHATSELKNLEVKYDPALLTKEEVEGLELLRFLFQIQKTGDAKKLFETMVEEDSNEPFLIAAISLAEQNDQYYQIQRALINRFNRGWNDENFRQTTAFRFYYPRAYKETVEKTAAKHGLNPMILYAIMREESHFNSKIASPAGAIGLMQLMPGTAKEVARRRKLKYRFQNMLEGKKNLDYGAYYFKGLMKRFDNHPELSLAAYNGGPGNVKKWIRKYGTEDMDLFVELIPFQETRNYVKKVLRTYMVYHFIY